MIDHEEKCLNAYIQSLKPEELQDLSQPLWLVAAIEPKGSLNNRIQVPKKIRLMLKLVDDLLKADETQVELNLFISMAKLQFVVKYCQFFDYIKIKSTIQFPAPYPDLRNNICAVELETLMPIKDDLQRMTQMIACCKYLRCEALY